MGRKKRRLPKAVDALREEIEEWRERRERRTRMPEELWEKAACAAREHGLWAVSRALRVNYGSLKKRWAATKGETGSRAGARVSEFVELTTSTVLGGAEPAGPVVEIVCSDGSKLTIRMPGRSPFDVYRLR